MTKGALRAVTCGVVLMSALMLPADEPQKIAAAPAAAELTTLVTEFLAGASRNDAAVHDRFWADDLIYTRAVGQRVGKAEILRDVRASGASKPVEPATTYTAEDVRIRQYGDTAVVAFRLVGTKAAGPADNYLNTGTFVKRGGRWQAAAWQATRVPAEAAASGKAGDGMGEFLASLTAPRTWRSIVAS